MTEENSLPVLVIGAGIAGVTIELRDDVAEYMALSDLDQLREEDPYTAGWTHVAPTRIIGTRSR